MISLGFSKTSASNRTASRVATMTQARVNHALMWALAGSLILSLAGCGSDPVTRGVSGGLMGAGAGAGVAALTGGKPATGALIGGGIGAVGGAATSP